MPNTKSAARRMRSSERKRLHNRAVAGRVKKLEKQYLALLTPGKGTEAATALRSICSALDKAVKSGVIPRNRADRSKSRLTLRLNALNAQPAAAKA
jgi:small subunit ribosomal protein S20